MEELEKRLAALEKAMEEEAGGGTELGSPMQTDGVNPSPSRFCGVQHKKET